jgi:2-polyprenyl-3-methyl-5-hydroxy-6-metoxy-1,4-benzoquinol methylase
MLSVIQKFKYLADSALRYREKVTCTYCGSHDCTVIDRKYMVTRLFECSNCHLYFRHPADRASQSHDFYQQEYQEMDNITTSMPSAEELERLKQDNFINGNKNARRYIDLFLALTGNKTGARVIDYGCSWGYISWQLKQAGFDIQSYEISKPRAAYGNQHLGLNIKTDEQELQGNCDIFFSSHVIEHHPSIPDMLQLARKLLKPDGYFVAFCPNGSPQHRQRDPKGFSLAWGKAHPSYLNARFFETVFSDHDYYIGGSPVNLPLANEMKQGRQVLDPQLSSEEIIVVSRINRKRTA